MTYADAKAKVFDVVVMPVIGQRYRLWGPDAYKDVWVLTRSWDDGCIFLRLGVDDNAQMDARVTWISAGSWAEKAACMEIRPV